VEERERTEDHECDSGMVETVHAGRWTEIVDVKTVQASPYFRKKRCGRCRNTHQHSVLKDGQTEGSSIISITWRMGGASCSRYPWSLYLQFIKQFQSRTFHPRLCHRCMLTLSRHLRSNTPISSVLVQSRTQSGCMFRVVQVSKRSFGCSGLSASSSLY